MGKRRVSQEHKEPWKSPNFVSTWVLGQMKCSGWARDGDPLVIFQAVIPDGFQLPPSRNRHSCSHLLSCWHFCVSCLFQDISLAAPATSLSSFTSFPSQTYFLPFCCMPSSVPSLWSSLSSSSTSILPLFCLLWILRQGFTVELFLFLPPLFSVRDLLAFFVRELHVPPPSFLCLCTLWAGRPSFSSCHL